MTQIYAHGSSVSHPILTAAAMRAAESAMAQSGVSIGALMDRAGAQLAALAFRVASGRPIHILCGPGNNGGDGYVTARLLAQRGADVRVSASAPPATDLAQAAHGLWTGGVQSLDGPAMDGAVIIDCLFGIGLSRPLDANLAAHLARHTLAAARTIAADLPSGLDCDDGTLLGCPYHPDITLAFEALKPAHLLHPAAQHCGQLHLASLGTAAQSSITTAAMPLLSPPGPADHKYTRGYVAIVAGSMAGAAELAARAALRSGAGYVRLIGSNLPPSPPFAIVRSGWRDGAPLTDPRISAIAIGSGLGQGDGAQERFAAALSTGKPLVIDADALALLPAALLLSGALRCPAILTPHAGEFARFGPHAPGNKIAQSLALAARTGAVVVHKGPDTVIAAPDGRVAIHAGASPWLASAGTGDVLTGICAAMLARGLSPFDAAQAAVLLHHRAALRVGPGLIADDLIDGKIWP